MLPDFRQWSTLSVIGILFNIFFFLIFSSFNPKVLKKIEVSENILADVNFEI